MLNNLLGIGMTLCFCGCYIPQLYTTFKTKDVNGLSLFSVLLSIGGMLCSVGYGISTTIIPWNLAKDLITFVFATILIVLYFKYKK